MLIFYTSLTCAFAIIAHAAEGSIFSLDIDNQTVEVGGKFSTFCTFFWSVANGIEFSLIQWTLNGSDAFTHYDNVEISKKSNAQAANSFLTISNINTNITGKITCSVSDEMNMYSASTSFYVLVEAPSRILRNPINIETQKGNTVSLQCIAQGVPLPKLTWYKNGKILNTSNKTVAFLQILNSSFVLSTLSVLNATQFDSGSYHCLADNVLESRGGNTTTSESMPALLLVYCPVHVLQSSSMLYTHAGDSLTIDCSFGGYSRPLVNLTMWYFNQSHLISTQNFKYSFRHEIMILYYFDILNTSLTLRNVTSVDSGIYTCVSSNCAPDCFITATANVSIIIQYPPSVTVHFEYVAVNITDNVTVDCTVFGIPIPSVLWTHNHSDFEIILDPFKPPSDIFITSHYVDDNTIVSSLLIINITKEREGIYSCYGMNGVTNIIDSQEEQEIEVFVQVPPQATSNISGVVYHLVNETAILYFTILDSSPPVVLTWKVLYPNNVTIVLTGLQDPRLSFSKDGLQLTINCLQRNDTGTYILIATNSAGTSSHSIDLYVGLFPSVSTSSNIATLNGTDNVTINCIVHAEPIAIVQWYFNDQLLDINTTIKYKVNADNYELTLIKIGVNDIGVYTCTGSNIFGSANSTTQLSVQVPPSFTKLSEVQYNISAGQSITLSCTATGLPIPSISWITPAHNEFAQTKYSTEVISNTSIHLVNVSLEHGGIYLCNASNSLFTELWSLSDEIVVDILYPPNVTGSSSHDVVVNQSDIIHIYCEISGIPPPFVFWMMNHETLYNNTEINISWAQISDMKVVSYLTVHEARKANEGNYTCIGSNIADNVIDAIGSQLIAVFVQVPPDVVADGGYAVIAIFNRSLVISFTIYNASPSVKNMNIKWTFTDTNGIEYPLNPDDVGIYVFSSNLLALTIYNVEISDEGFYSLTARNLAGSSKASIFVDVEVPPMINSSTTVSVVEGHVAVMYCMADAEPLYSVSWTTPDGSPITTNDKYFITLFGDLHGSLMIENVTYADSGLYECTASNIHGTDSITVDLVVQVPPVVTAPPISVLSYGGQSIHLSCSYSGYPIPTVIWIKDNHTLKNDLVNSVTTMYNTSETSVTSTLLLFNITYFDTGLYYCHGYNYILSQLSTNSSTALVTVNYPARVALIDGDNNVTEGMSYTVTCEGFGRPLPIVTWSTELITSDRYSVNTNITTTVEGFCVVSVLVISPTLYSDTGVLNCTATNAANGNDQDFAHDTASIHVTVSTIPVLKVVNLSSIVAVVGDNVTIEVMILRAVPSVSMVYWNFTSGIVKEHQFNASNMSVSNRCIDGRCSMSFTSIIITIVDISIDDEGQYSISAMNEVGQTSVVVLVNVEAPPFIVVLPQDVSQYEGFSALLKCKAFSDPIYSVVWSLNDHLIASTIKMVNRTRDYKIYTDPHDVLYGYLMIISVHYQTLGNYTCVAENIHGHDSATSTVTLLVDPVFSVVEQFLALIGDNTSIFVKISNKPFPDINVFRWYYNGLLIGNNAKYKISHQDAVFKLMIDSVQLYDSGSYTIFVSNTASNQTISVNLTIQAKPFINVSQLLSEVLVDHGSSKELYCLYDGSPNPEVDWLKNDGLVATSEGIEIILPVVVSGKHLRDGLPLYMSVLYFTYLTEQDNGTYSCKVSNSHGVITKQLYSISVKPEFIDYCVHKPCVNGICSNQRSSYSCLCVTGWIGVNCSISASFEMGPEIIEGPEPAYVEIYSSVSLNCLCTGNPQPIIQWYRNGQPLNGENTAVLVIKRLDLNTRGKYYCTATNKIDQQASDEVYVKIKGLAQYRILLNLTKEFVDSIQDPIVRREISDYSLDKLVDMITELSSVVLGLESMNDVATYFKVELQNPSSIKSLLEPIPILITLVLNNAESSFDLKGDIRTKLHLAIQQIGYEYSISIDKISRFDGCELEETVNLPFDNNTEIPFILTWIETDIGQTRKLRCPCGTDDFNIGIIRNAHRQCLGSFLEGAQWQEPYDDECKEFSLSARKLCQLSLLTEPNEKLDGLDVITGNTDEIGSLEISISTVFVEDLDENVKGNQTLSTTFLNVVNNLLNVTDEEFRISNDESNSSRRILSSFEQVLNTYPVNSTNFENVLLIQTTYAASIQEITSLYSKDISMIDLMFTVDENFGSNLSDNDDLIKFEDFNIRDSSASIKLPQSVLDSTLNNISASTRIVFSVYNSQKLFLRQKNITEQDKYLVVGSSIISASVLDDDFFNDTMNEFVDPVIIILRKDEVFRQNAMTVQCSFWDPVAYDGFGNWSSKGCYTVNETIRTVTCACDHLTTFALIMDVAPIQDSIEDTTPKELEHALSAFSLIGNIVSIFSLSLIIFTYLADSKLRRSHNGKLLLSLCSALLGLNFVFILAVHVSKHVFILCVINGAILHYFILTCFLAMASEATVLYFELVQVFAAGKENLPIKVALVTWITPVFIVLFSLAFDYRKYANDAFCMPTGWQFIGGSIIPFGVIYTYNWIMFIIIIVSISKQQTKMKVSTGNQALQSNFKKQLIMLLTLSLLFGLGWGLGLAATNSLPYIWLRTLFEILFIVLTGFQGLFIFILYGVRLRKIRLLWLKWTYIMIGQRARAARLDISSRTTVSTRESRRVRSTMKQDSFPAEDKHTSIKLTSYEKAPVANTFSDNQITDLTVETFLGSSLDHGRNNKTSN